MKNNKQNKKQPKIEKGMVSRVGHYLVWTIFSLAILIILLLAWLLPAINLKHN